MAIIITTTTTTTTGLPTIITGDRSQGGNVGQETQGQ
jgi:hypothetical protein